MATLKEDALSTFMILFYLLIGFILTVNGLNVIYEYFGIPFTGNVWVNWFGISYLVYFFHTIIRGLFIHNNRQLFKERFTSILFWVLFIGALYVVFIPFIKGENPF